MATATTTTQDFTKKTTKRRLEDFWRYVKRNPSLDVGLGLFLALFLFVAITCPKLSSPETTRSKPAATV